MQRYFSIEQWLSSEWDGNSASGTARRIRDYLVAESHDKCVSCGWGEKNIVTGKACLELHHVDGNPFNSKRDNLQILCPNCHSLTANYRNTGNTTSTRIRRAYAKSKQKAVAHKLSEKVIVERIHFLESLTSLKSWTQCAGDKWKMSRTSSRRWTLKHFPEFAGLAQR